ncbi:hypothetical protein J1N35_019082 [Gossypium stocksii]|uniref:Uncharacterized protein n=1 Tax=Gossypium stocksii TaxID=47602 RepID=A0A9D4A7S3_9ROSI|nr:hypothetical protein J1N35_019082 [Gossypium stocksii]
MLNFVLSVNLILGHASFDLDYLLSDMVVDNGIWNLDLFRLWLHETIIRKIIRIPPPHSAVGANRIIWGGMRTGSFFVKSVYGKIREGFFEIEGRYLEDPLEV